MLKKNFFTLSYWTKVLCIAALFGTFMLTSCDDDDPETPQPVMPADDDEIFDVVDNTASFSLLEAALRRVSDNGGTDLVAALSDSTSLFTVFAPSDAAFNASGFADVDAINAVDVATLENILNYHVVVGSGLTASQLVSGPLTAANSQRLNITSNSGGVSINGKISVSQADIQTTNGVIHAIDMVLTPPSQDVTEIAIALSQDATNPEFTSLVAALTQASLVTALQDAQANFTVLAPTDSAFAKFLDQLGFASLADVPNDLLTQVLLYHVIPSGVFSSDLSQGLEVSTTLNTNPDNLPITVDLTGGNVSFNSLNSSRVADPNTQTDILATNGVIHVIDNVLIPNAEFTITQLAQVGDNFTLLEAAAIGAGLTDELGDTTATLTVFAPDDAAFAASNLDLTFLSSLTEAQAAEIIGYHALGTTKLAADFGTGGPEPTLAPVVTIPDQLDLFISTDGGVFINPGNPGQNIQVTTANVNAKNGVLHVIPQVILPPSVQFGGLGTVENIVDTLSKAGTPEFTQLLAAITRAGLGGVLADPSRNFTVFAPTDAAFQVLYDSLGVTGVDDIDAGTLATVLQYHIVDLSTRAYSTNLGDGDMLTMFGGSGMVTANVNAGGITLTATDAALSVGLDDATVTGANVVATNGVVHIIDRVLLP